MTVVGVFGPPADAEVRALAARLENRGAEPWVVDLSGMPARSAVTFASDGARFDGRPLADMDAAYLRRVGTTLPGHANYLGEALPERAWDDSYHATLEVYRTERVNLALRTTVLADLALRRPVINPPGPQNLHRLKTYELDRLARAGLPVPALRAGTASGPLCDFARAAGERWSGAVDKPLAGIYKTQLWTGERADSHRWGRRPALYQRYVQGDTIRAYVVGGALVAAARIVHGGTVDSSLSQTGIEVVALESRGREVAESTARALGLEFCGMDLQRDGETGELFVIDCNLSPMFEAFGRLSRVDIAGHLADRLIACAGERRPVRRPEVVGMVADAKELFARDPDIARLLAGRKKGSD